MTTVHDESILHAAARGQTLEIKNKFMVSFYDLTKCFEAVVIILVTNFVWPMCNLSGSVSSPWVDIRTLEASPARLTDFTVEQREQGRALLLSWDQPRTPNGVITVRNRLSNRTSLHKSNYVRCR